LNLYYILTAYPPYIGGAQLHQHYLAKAFRAEHAVQVSCHWDSTRTDWLLGTTLRQPRQGSYRYEGIEVHRLGLNWKDKLRLLPILPLYYPLMPWAVNQVGKILVGSLTSFVSSADLIHNVRIGREGLSYASWQLARRWDVPFVLTPVHHPRWRGWRYRVYDKIYQQADAVIALTLSERRTLVDLGIADERIHVTGVGPVLSDEGNAERFQKSHSIAQPFVLFLGQHYPYKGFRQVLEAAPKVWQRFPDLNFVFIGPTVRQSERAFYEFADARIHRLGAVDLQTKTDALAACSLLCVPSSQESFGGVYTEAWSFEKPVIGGRAPAIADVITDGKDGFLVSQDPAEIADRILYLLDHPTEAAAMGQAGKAKVEAKYTWPKLAEKTMQVYRHVCG
jgi:glycosyltransferase involved in cell wall biosynthesis